MTSDCKITRIQAMGSLYPDGTLGGKRYDPGSKTWLSMTTMRAKLTLHMASYQLAFHGRYETVNE